MDPHAIFMEHFRIVTDPSRLSAGRRVPLTLRLSAFLNRSPGVAAQPGLGRGSAAVPGAAGGTRAPCSL